MVEADDIHICTRNTLRAEAARDWALGLINDGKEIGANPAD